MSRHSKAKQLVGFAFLVALARERDGITKAEIALLERVANDSEAFVTDKERQILRNLFEQIDTEEVVQAVIEGMEEFRKQLGV